MLNDNLVCQVDHLFKAVGPTGGMFLAFRTHGIFPGNSVVSSLTDFPLLLTTSLFTGEPIACIIPVVASCVPAGTGLPRTCCHDGRYLSSREESGTAGTVSCLSTLKILCSYVSYLSALQSMECTLKLKRNKCVYLSYRMKLMS